MLTAFSRSTPYSLVSAFSFSLEPHFVLEAGVGLQLLQESHASPAQAVTLVQAFSIVRADCISYATEIRFVHCITIITCEVSDDPGARRRKGR